MILEAADIYSDLRDEEGWGYFNVLKFAHPLFEKDSLRLRYALSEQPKVVDRNRSRIERLIWQIFHAPIRVIAFRSEDTSDKRP